MKRSNKPSVERLLDGIKGTAYDPGVKTKWNVTLRTTVEVGGSTLCDLQKHVRDLGFTADEIMSYELVDSHLDLPLVIFDYPKSDGGTPHPRRVRIAHMYDDCVEGYEGNQYKQFTKKWITSDIVLLELPKK